MVVIQATVTLRDTSCKLLLPRLSSKFEPCHIWASLGTVTRHDRLLKIKVGKCKFMVCGHDDYCITI
jgi:hypothetical protein